MNNSDGFTLIEVMIALVVLAVGILAVVGLFTTSIKGNDMGRKVTEVTSLGQSRLDELMTAVTYDNLPSEEGTETGLDSTGNTGGFYTRQTELDHITTMSGADVDMYLITVTVSWQGLDRVHTYSFQSLRASDQ